jgi:hypothetical protein
MRNGLGQRWRTETTAAWASSNSAVIVRWTTVPVFLTVYVEKVPVCTLGRRSLIFSPFQPTASANGAAHFARTPAAFTWHAYLFVLDKLHASIRILVNEDFLNCLHSTVLTVRATHAAGSAARDATIVFDTTLAGPHILGRLM